MKLSYIVPVYMVEEYIRQCIDSILMQTMDDYEIILVDDGSPDNCPQICDEYKAKYPDKVVVIHKENGGLASARNAGISKATGEYIFFVDSDDFLVSDSIKQLYNKAVEYKADVVHTSYFKLESEKSEKEKVENPLAVDILMNHSDMEKEICHASKKRFTIFVWRNLYRRQFIESNNIRFNESLRMVEDAPFDVWAFCVAKRFVAVDIPLYCYRIRDNSLQRIKYVKDYDLIIEYQWKLKLKNYEKFCSVDNAYYADLAEYTIKAILPTLILKVYRNKVKEEFSLLKRIGNSEMMRRSFNDYDINNFKSKSLDWVMTNFIKKKRYFLAHLLCKYVLYK